MTKREGPDEELEALGLALRRLPTPRPPEALVSRVRTLAHLELATQADERLNRLVLALLLVFSWTASLVPVLAVRLLTAENLLASAMGRTLSWSVASVAFVWISGAAALVVLSVYVRKERRLA
jgi:hypothetical protein